MVLYPYIKIQNQWRYLKIFTYKKMNLLAILIKDALIEKAPFAESAQNVLHTNQAQKFVWGNYNGKRDNKILVTLKSATDCTIKRKRLLLVQCLQHQTIVLR